MFDANFHSITAEGYILFFQLLPRLVSDIMSDRIRHEANGGEDRNEDEENE